MDWISSDLWFISVWGSFPVPYSQLIQRKDTLEGLMRFVSLRWNVSLIGSSLVSKKTDLTQRRLSLVFDWRSRLNARLRQGFVFRRLYLKESTRCWVCCDLYKPASIMAARLTSMLSLMNWSTNVYTEKPPLEVCSW